ncbi:hypothetical protein QBC47DRAFT_383814 [Echria macrotheca]|uniref:Uncharacterized protein n=1 Tax=Echria macrotheca TaxID=438768 RepID=A0AAJ0BAC8_9PEZI|nr:hypothetical protein QBC47DRAFT_383814 [Echria macrotheca]
MSTNPQRRPLGPPPCIVNAQAAAARRPAEPARRDRNVTSGERRDERVTTPRVRDVGRTAADGTERRQRDVHVPIPIPTGISQGGRSANLTRRPVPSPRQGDIPSRGGVVVELDASESGTGQHHPLNQPIRPGGGGGGGVPSTAIPPAIPTRLRPIPVPVPVPGGEPIDPSKPRTRPTIPAPAMPIPPGTSSSSPSPYAIRDERPPIPIAPRPEIARTRPHERGLSDPILPPPGIAELPSTFGAVPIRPGGGGAVARSHRPSPSISSSHTHTSTHTSTGTGTGTGTGPHPPPPESPLPPSLSSPTTTIPSPNTPDTFPDSLTPLERDFARRHAEMCTRARLLLAEFSVLSAAPPATAANGIIDNEESETDRDRVIAELTKLLDGKLASVVARPAPPRAVRAVAREVVSLFSGDGDGDGGYRGEEGDGLGEVVRDRAVDLLVSDLERVALWAGAGAGSFSSTSESDVNRGGREEAEAQWAGGTGTPDTSDGSSSHVRRVLKERTELLSAALPARWSSLARDAEMHFEHEFGYLYHAGGYVNSATAEGLPVARIPRARFITTSDGFAFDVAELVAAGGRANPLTGDALAEEDVRRVREHVLGRHLPQGETELYGDQEYRNGDVFSDEAAVPLLGPTWNAGEQEFARTRAESVSSMEEEREAASESAGPAELLRETMERTGRDREDAPEFGDGHFTHHERLRAEGVPVYEMEARHEEAGREDARITQQDGPIRPTWQLPSLAIGDRRISLHAPGAFPRSGEDEDPWDAR